MSIRDEMNKLAHQAGGSFKTREARKLSVSRISKFLLRENIQIKNIIHLKEKHVTKYVETRKQAGIALRTIQNEVSALRVTLIFAGRETLAKQIANKKLEISNATRRGNKAAIKEDRLLILRAEVEQRDKGVAAVVDLQRAIGLRAEEGVKANKSLDSWLRQLSKGEPLRVIFGTKNGKPRDVRPADPERAAKAILAAIEIRRQNKGVLVAKPNEKQAMNRYKNVMSAAGFIGKESGHALRYAFAQEQIKHYTSQGFSVHEALAQTSMDLGHGDGRGRYIKQVYGVLSHE